MAERPEMIRSDIERTRGEMDETLDALGYKANVPARTRGWVGRKTSGIGRACGSGLSRVSGAADSVVAKVSGTTHSTTPSTGDVQAGAGQVKGMAESNPLGLAAAGAAVGFVAGVFAPSTSVENEKLGPISDQAKTSAVEAGREALDHGKQVVQAAAQTAADTARDEARQHGEELSASVQEKARDVRPGSG